MYPVIAEQVIPIFEQDVRRGLAAAERARLIREHAAASPVPRWWSNPLARARTAATAAIAGLVRSGADRSVELGGEAALESELVPTGPTAFQRAGTISFGTGGTGFASVRSAAETGSFAGREGRSRPTPL